MIEPESTDCPCGCGEMDGIGEDRSERLDIVPAQLRVIVTVRPKYACRGCEQGVVQAPAPARPIKGGLPTEGALAHVLVSKYADHSTLYRQAQIYARSGLDLDRSTLAGWVGKASFHLRPVADRLARHLKQSSKLFMDETRAPVVDPGRGKTKTGWLWALARDDRPWGGADPRSHRQRPPEQPSRRPPALELRQLVKLTNPVWRSYRSDVLRQAQYRAEVSDATRRLVLEGWTHTGGDAARDVVEQALMRGSRPHVHDFVRGWSSLTTGVGDAGVFGGMVFFAFVYAPLVFIKLGTEAGGRFIREVFPVYYVTMCAVSLVAAALLAFASAALGAAALAMACIGIVFFLARFALLPIINRNRDAGQAGVLAAKKRFDLLHRVSVIANLVQMLAVLVVLVRYAAY